MKRAAPRMVLALGIVGVTLPARAQAPPGEGLFGHLFTSKGEIVIRLAFVRTPMTVANFVGLAEGTIANDAFPPRTPFFDGTTFHRVVPGHVIQGGIPASERARGSGRTIPNEIDRTLSHDHAGAVGMANGGPHTATNQFYVTLGDRSYLDGDYAVFGDVVLGLDVAMRIERDDRIDSVRIVRVGDDATAFRPTTESFLAMVDRVGARVTAAEQRHRADDAAFVSRRWPEAVATDSGWQYVIIEPGAGQPVGVGDTVLVSYTGRTVSGLQFAGTGNDGAPSWLPVAGADLPFAYVVGSNAITRGFDAAVTTMRHGEKRLVIVPAALAYGTSGYYAPSREGERRFVISPNTMLIYEITLRPD